MNLAKSTKMKIAFLVGQFPLLSETFVLNQIAGLLDRGHEVQIYALDGVPANMSKVHPIVEEYHLCDRTSYSPIIPKNYIWRLFKGLKLLLTNIQKGSLACLPLLNFFKYGRQAYSLRLFYRGISLSKQETYEIIHCQFGTFGLIGRLFRHCGLIRGKLITTFRGHDISWAIEEYGDRVYDPLFAEGDFFLTNCEFFRNRIVKLGCDEKKILIHASGIDCAKFAFSSRTFPPEGRIRVATVGRLVEKKGIEYGIRAIAKVISVYPHIEFNIIGDGPLTQHFQTIIKELDLDSTVNLLGAKQQQEIIEILDKSHIFIAPSITAADGNQDAPLNTLKEAMAMGLPVISTAHGGIPELVEDGISGFLVSERDTDAIAAKINYLIEHPALWSEMGRAGRARVEAKYDTNKLNDELVEIYQQQLMQIKGVDKR
jgi:colanic acid/amylovoran biosynthesis glycosyltransferase